MKSFPIFRTLLLSLGFLALSGCTNGTSGACKYEQSFGIATITKIEKNTAYVSFSIEDENGKSTQYPQPLSLPAPWGVKVGDEYPALLHLYRSGPSSCEKEKLILIQEIGEACRVK